MNEYRGKEKRRTARLSPAEFEELARRIQDISREEIVAESARRAKELILAEIGSGVARATVSVVSYKVLAVLTIVLTALVGCLLKWGKVAL